MEQTLDRRSHLWTELSVDWQTYPWPGGATYGWSYAWTDGAIRGRREHPVYSTVPPVDERIYPWTDDSTRTELPVDGRFYQWTDVATRRRMIQPLDGRSYPWTKGTYQPQGSEKDCGIEQIEAMENLAELSLQSGSDKNIFTYTPCSTRRPKYMEICIARNKYSTVVCRIQR